MAVDRGFVRSRLPALVSGDLHFAIDETDRALALRAPADLLHVLVIIQG